MTSAFVWTSGGAVRKHLTGDAAVTAQVDGDEYELEIDEDEGTGANGELVQDVRGVWLAVELDVLIPAGISGVRGGEGRSLQRLHLDLLRGEAIRYRPNADQEHVDFEVRPDLGHRPTLRAYKSGSLHFGTTLRFKSRYRYAPSAPLLQDLAENTNTDPEA